jgi:hypothetical protein
MNAPATFTWNNGAWATTTPPNQLSACSPGLRLVTQIFRASGTYTPSPGLVTAVVDCVGGGGGGGGVNVGAGATATILSGGGGGAGGYSRATLAGSLVLGGVAVTVGAGGTGSEVGANGTGGSGYPTSFGTMCVANGGGGGNDAIYGTSTAGQPGFGGPAGVGDLNFSGSSGGGGTTKDLTGADQLVGLGGVGGAGPYGGGPAIAEAWVGANANGYSPAVNSGGGGSGGVVNQCVANTTANGGPGGSGICIVTEYLMLGTTSSCGCGATVQSVC